MTVDASQFSKVADFGPVNKLEREVKTPMPEGETEENRMVVYEADEHLVKVSKVTDRGWTATHYQDGELEDMHMGYTDTSSEAHVIARGMIEEVLEDE